jgi:hypothetical protein
MFEDTFEDAEGFYDWLVLIAEAAGTNLEVLAPFASLVVGWFVDATDETEDMVGWLELVRLALVSIVAPVALFRDAVVGLEYVFDLFNFWAETAGLKVKEWILGAMLEVQTFLSKLPFSNITDEDLAAIEGQLQDVRTQMENTFAPDIPEWWTADVWDASMSASNAIKDMVDKSETQKARFNTYAEEMEGAVSGIGAAFGDGFDFEGIETDMWELIDLGPGIGSALGDAFGDADDWADAFGDLAEFTGETLDSSKKLAPYVSGIKEDEEDAALAAAAFKAAAEEAELPIRTTADGVTVIGEKSEDAAGYIMETKDGAILLTNEIKDAKGETKLLGDNIKGVGEKVDDINDKGGIDLKTVDAKQKMELLESSMKEFSGIIQTYIEWEAKLEIAQLEADTQRAVAAGESISTAFSAAADATAQAFGGLADVPSIHFYEYLALVERQLEIQAALAEAQIDFTEAQTEYFRLRNEALKKGDPTSQVNVAVQGDMEGWLSGLMESLFNEVFIKASAEGFNVLAEG